MKDRKKIKMGISLIMVIFYFVSVLVVGNVVAFNYYDLITDQLKQKSYELQTIGNTEEIDAQYYKADFNRTKKFLAAEQEYIDEVQKESMVLLQNAGLPLSSAENKITLFGVNSHQKKFAAGSGSSGYAVDSNGRAIDEAFRDAGFSINQAMFDFYARSPSVEYAANELDEAALDAVAEYNDAGIIFIGRGGGEGNDIMKADMALTDAEKSLIDFSLAHCKKTVVILNTGNQVECGYMDGKDVSVVLVGTTGAAGIGAIPQMLNGTVNPSGHLVDTYAYDVNSAPASYSVGEIWWEGGSVEYNGGSYSTSYVNYVENIYVGYRYYETRYADTVERRQNVGSFDYAAQVQYPFGYGLSYTEFGYSGFSLAETSDTVTCTVTVSNTGSVAGKDAVELYMQSPYTQYDIDHGVEKSAIQLVGFAKTEELLPGQSQTISIEVSKEEMKAYDSTGAKTYIVDAGEYYFSVGCDVHDALNNILALKGMTVSDGMTVDGNAALVGSITVARLDTTTYATSAETGAVITNQFDDVRLDYYYDDVIYLSRSNWEGTFPKQVDEGRKPTQEMIANSKPAFVNTEVELPTMGENNGINLITLKGEEYGLSAWDALLDQMTSNEMMQLYANAGFHTLKVDSVGKPAQVDNDGTNGLYSNFFDGTRPLVFPGEPTMAATWDLDLIRQEGYYTSQAVLLTGLTGWYAPGANLHRLPCNGRNVDYFSEDPYMASKCAAAICYEATERGVVCYVKHFVLNEQEANRTGVATFCTEQALRELYLRPFEEAMTDGNALGTMTAMNYVGMKYCSANPNLLTNVVRNEWGFNGTVLTDATSRSSEGKMNPRDILLSGTDLILCSGDTKGFYIDGYESDPLVLTALRNAAHRSCYATVNSIAMNGISPSTIVVSVTPPWVTWLIAADVIIGVVAVAGLALIVRNLLLQRKKRKV